MLQVNVGIFLPHFFLVSLGCASCQRTRSRGVRFVQLPIYRNVHGQARAGCLLCARLFVCFGLGLGPPHPAPGLWQCSGWIIYSCLALSGDGSLDLPCLAVSCVKVFVKTGVWKMFMNECDKWPNVQDIKIKIIAWANIYFSFFCTIIFAAWLIVAPSARGVYWLLYCYYF